MKDIDVLIEALPYIKKFHDEKILIKYGGHAMVDDEAKSSTARDTVLLKYVGMKPIIVHGGGPEISRSMDKLGKEPKFIKGLRVTDEETMEIIEMVLVGKISTEIVSELIKHDGDAISLSGKDSSLIFAHKKEASRIDEEIVDLGLVGEVDCINTDLLEMFIDNDYIPVISPIGIAEDGTSLNLNADTAAGEVASAMGAEKLIILTDVPGVLRDPNDPDSLIQKIRIDEVPGLIEEGVISGGMIPKIETCVQAIENGVKSCHIIDGRKKHSLLLEVFTTDGIGTMIFK
ncbi:acetylglutamate kinase [Methanobrevibacter sp.]|uniref:acetylglutamate kinase n=1 Tax=Methanobrevibacter sp. TaxID=66852 RepID=UPI0025ED2DDE|nr:acetylglutamate kinase [Methanobrevibacter sp.]MBQ6098377.1 acetylglutamate kinase [Methanobrevibacter sp.]MBQ6513071.1 acetylglutamate kinase [Methanobrevibacter sp.]